MSRPQHAPSQDPADWPAALEAACTQAGMVRPFFQPIVDLTRGVVTGYEALARFSGPPQAGPDRWFAEATAHGCADRLEAQVLRSSLAARDALPVNCFLTVNCTPTTLPSEAVQEVFAAAGDLSGLVVEITEQVPVDDYEALSRAVAGTAGFDPEPFVRVVRHVRGTEKLSAADAGTVLAGYLTGMEQLVAHLDRFDQP